MDARLEQLIDDIRETAADAEALLVPVSGGSDSALGFWLCCQAFPEKAFGVHAGTNLRAREWFESVGRIELIGFDGAEKEETRWAKFLALNLERRAWLVGSRNRTEDLLGTYSLASRLATYLPLVNVWKSRVMELCRIAGVPDEIIASSYRADPECGRPADLAAIPYGKIETFLKFTLGQGSHRDLEELSIAELVYLGGLLQRNAFKKRLPILGRPLRPDR